METRRTLAVLFAALTFTLVASGPIFVAATTPPGGSHDTAGSKPPNCGTPNTPPCVDN